MEGLVLGRQTRFLGYEQGHLRFALFFQDLEAVQVGTDAGGLQTGEGEAAVEEVGLQSGVFEEGSAVLELGLGGGDR